MEESSYEKTKNKLLVIISILVILSIIFLFDNAIFNYSKDKIIVEDLTNEQIISMIELDVIKVSPILSENKNDVDLKIKAKTNIGDCRLYKDIFGRYYCRW